MKWIIDHIPKTTLRNRRPGITMEPTTITIHNTGNEKSTARNERNYLTNAGNTRQASYHIVMDEKEAIECIPLNETAWHAGDSRGDGNMKSIGIEICESGNYTKNVENAVELVAKLLKERGWGVDRLRRHFDWSRKICPRLMYNNGSWQGWEGFKRQVQLKLDKKEDISVDKDQTVSAWAKESMAWGTKEGITDGKDPKEPLTREQMVTMMHRYHLKFNSK